MNLPWSIFRKMYFLCFILVQVVLLGTQANSDEKGVITLNGLTHPLQKMTYVTTPMVRLEWMEDGSLVETQVDKGTTTLFRINPSNWVKTPLLSSGTLTKVLVEAGATEASVKKSLSRSQFTWNLSRSGFLIIIDENIFFVDLRSSWAKQLTFSTSPKDELSFSPSGKHVAYLKGNDLFISSIEDPKEIALTSGGSETIFNGRLDWVYMEEIYGRGNLKGYWWNPDGTSIAYLSIDETKVPIYTLTDDRGLHQIRKETRYPQAGDPNPIVKLGLIQIDRPQFTEWISDPYSTQDILIVQVGFTPSGDLLASYQNRAQTWLDLRLFPKNNVHQSSVLIREESKAWQERLPLPVFIADGSFLWESDRTGFRHIYRYSPKGNLINAVTQGEWNAQFQGINPRGDKVYFSSPERVATGQDAYSISIDGSQKTRLTHERGFHQTRWNPEYTLFIDQWSNVESTPKVALRNQSGEILRIIAQGTMMDLKWGTVRFQQVPTRDGFLMESMLVLPPNMKPGKKYPVFQHVYGGPNAPQVIDRWNSSQMLWFHFLAQQGYIVWVCDNRSASDKGVQSAYPIHKNMGALELQDQLDGLRWLEKQGFADMERIALEGWSYGGYLTAFFLTHSKAWKVGIVGAPVTDWHYYDSIYTERYMGLPEDNPKGYKTSSVIQSAQDLSGKILILHGTMDDNVHPINSISFINKLQDAHKTYELQIYPGSDHGVRIPSQVYSKQMKIWSFIQSNL
ncbi:MAG: DPP IV N-terminal domain-containing protein [Holophagaceae bacterium]